MLISSRAYTISYIKLRTFEAQNGKSVFYSGRSEKKTLSKTFNLQQHLEQVAVFSSYNVSSTSREYCTSFIFTSTLNFSDFKQKQKEKANIIRRIKINVFT